MPPASAYHPAWFYFITLAPSFILGFILVVSQEKIKGFLFPLLFLSIAVPAITALVMIYTTADGILVGDFWKRLLLFKINPSYLMVILFLMPTVLLLGTGLSLLFGYSTDQFKLAQNLSVMKGWSWLGIVVPLLIAPALEELGWRGYGVDSLRANHNLFITSALFGLLWAAWHLPLFFIKGYYHNQLLDMGLPYVINFFVSILVIAFLMNWVYYKTDRSIPAIILSHGMLNLCFMLFQTEPFTKCIITVLLCVVTLSVIIYDWNYFFWFY